MEWREGLAWALLMIYGISGYVYGQTFRNEQTVWARAVERAQHKPRPRVQYSLALMERQRFDEAWTQLDALSVILGESQIRPFDRTEGETALVQNRMLLSRLTETHP